MCVLGLKRRTTMSRMSEKQATGNWTDNGTGNGYFVSSVNTGDSVAYAYHAEKPGIYEFTARYRSGSNDNHYTWSSTDSKIVAGSVQAGHTDGKPFTVAFVNGLKTVYWIIFSGF